MHPGSAGPRPGAAEEPGRWPAMAGPFSASHWASTGRPKYSRLGVERVVPPRETLRRAEPMLGRIGVTRLAEVGRLDRPGLPNFVAVRPERAAEGISYYNGKGVTRRQARAGAVMEAIERFSAARCRAPRRVASHASLSREARAVDPRALLIPMGCDYHPDLEMDWALGFDLLASRPAYVPIESVLLAPSPRLMMSSSNGLASGNTVEEALCHALCEVIERDALAMRDAAMGLRRALGGLMSGLGMAYDPSPPRVIRRIDHHGLPPRASRILRRLRAGGLDVYLRDITSDIGVATIACSLAECRVDGWAVHEGFGCHPDARVALTRALTEAYQGRIAHIQGGREDLPEVVAGGTPVADPAEALGAGPSGPFALVRSVEHTTVGEDVAYLLGALQSAGVAEVIAFDLTDPAIGIPVVRAIVPGLECWSMFRAHGARGVLGARALSLLH